MFRPRADSAIPMVPAQGFLDFANDTFSKNISTKRSINISTLEYTKLYHLVGSYSSAETVSIHTNTHVRARSDSIITFERLSLLRIGLRRGDRMSSHPESTPNTDGWFYEANMFPVFCPLIRRSFWGRILTMATISVGGSWDLAKLWWVYIPQLSVQSCDSNQVLWGDTVVIIVLDEISACALDLPLNALSPKHWQQTLLPCLPLFVCRRSLYVLCMTFWTKCNSHSKLPMSDPTDLGAHL